MNTNAMAGGALAGLVKTGVQRAPLRILLYGVEGIGKTTWAAGAPAPLFLGTEDGYGDLDVHRLPTPQTWADVRQALSLVAREPHQYRTLVIDTIDHLERLVWAEVCRANDCKSIEDLGYGKGYVAALELFERFANGLDMLRQRRGMHIVLLGHATTATVQNPEGADYSRYTLKMHKGAAAFWKEWPDVLLFAQRDVTVKTDKRGDRALFTRGKATGGRRVVMTEGSPAYDAKSRFKLPPTLPLDFRRFAEALHLEAYTPSVDLPVDDDDAGPGGIDGGEE